MHAVDPRQVRAEARNLDAGEVLAELQALPPGPDLVVISGGNPALLELGPLVDTLHRAGFEVAVETQGSRWKAWLADVDCLVISPKGPSSGMDTEAHRTVFKRFMAEADEAALQTHLKIVIFDDDDLDFARQVTQRHPDAELFLSVGTDQGQDNEQTLRSLLARLRWLSETVAGDTAFKRARVSTQQHVLTWGTRKGV